MNTEEIIRMARKAGFSFETGQDLRDNIPALERFAALVAAHEREMCAKVCEEFVEDMDFDCDMTLNQVGDLMAKYCAAAIRARGSNVS